MKLLGADYGRTTPNRNTLRLRRNMERAPRVCDWRNRKSMHKWVPFLTANASAWYCISTGYSRDEIKIVGKAVHPAKIGMSRYHHAKE